jgi:hypothetical protein
MRGSTNLSRFSGKTRHVYCGRESCHASMALSRWVATRANQRATATEILLVEMFYHSRSLHMQICVSYGILPYFFSDISTTPSMTRWSSDFYFLITFFRWWSTDLVTWTSRATSCRTGRAAIYRLQLAEFASPLQVLLSLRQYHSDSSTFFKLHGAPNSKRLPATRSESEEAQEGKKKPNGWGRSWDVSFTDFLLPCSRRRVNLKPERLRATAGFKRKVSC